MDSITTIKPSFLASFSRSQVAAFGATLLDYSTLFVCTEIFHVWYVLATALGAFLGAVANFLINRHWSFKASGGSMGLQVKRYTFVSGTSLLLNTLGVYFVTEYFGIHYAISVAIVSILVAILFNYPLHRHYVYK